MKPFNFRDNEIFFSGQEESEQSQSSSKTVSYFDNRETEENGPSDETNLLLKEIENFTKAFEAEEFKNKFKFGQQQTEGKKV